MARNTLSSKGLRKPASDHPMIYLLNGDLEIVGATAGEALKEACKG